MSPMLKTLLICWLANIKDFMQAMMKYPIHSNGLLNHLKSWQTLLNPLLGVVFLNTNNSLETVCEVFRRLATPLINPKNLGKHPMSKVYEKQKMDVMFLKGVCLKTKRLRSWLMANWSGVVMTRGRKLFKIVLRRLR